jgi:hypothetical protein
MKPAPVFKWILFACLLAGLSTTTPAADVSPVNPADNLPGIALIIDDLGNQNGYGKQAVQLPGPVACSFLPHGPYTRSLARLAHAQNKEVMLHLPMEAMHGSHPDHEQGELTLDMTQQQFREVLAGDIAAVPFVSGLNNHMGSLLTRHPGHMAWLMESLNQRGSLFFVDSRTTHETVARRLAVEYGIPATDRNVFLDNEPEAEAVRKQFRELVEVARRKGTALGIGHPRPETLEVLREELAGLEEKGIRLLPVSELIALQNRKDKSWRVSSSR